jgi:hypothetical protein
MRTIAADALPHSDPVESPYCTVLNMTLTSQELTICLLLIDSRLTSSASI